MQVMSQKLSGQGLAPLEPGAPKYFSRKGVEQIFLAERRCSQNSTQHSRHGNDPCSIEPNLPAKDSWKSGPIGFYFLAGDPIGPCWTQALRLSRISPKRGTCVSWRSEVHQGCSVGLGQGPKILSTITETRMCEKGHAG